MRNAYKILVGKPEAKIPLGSPRRRWEDNIKIDLKETVCEDVGRIRLAQYGISVNTLMNLMVS
jgi:hypothetical protein